ncbi:MAG: 50S ribosomal protein L29 [Verrucomicrobiales bacterium]|nr:50S ribosomal protein L29 [Verrucomicrobiales bacterium]
MATVKTKELRELGNDELAAQLADLKQETLNLRIQQQSGQLENPARLRIVRRQIAKIETVFNQRRQVASAKEA